MLTERAFKEELANLSISRGLKLYSEFDKDVLDYPINQIFGVFVSIQRSKNFELSEYPKDVHGCIGYWNKSFANLSNKKLLSKIWELAPNSTWKDQRSKFFEKSIYLDLNAYYKIYLMKNPVISIDDETGILNNGQKFNPDKHGVIVQDDKGGGATFLPGVFSGEEWNIIKEKLKSKSGKLTNYNFYCYECILIKKSLASYLIGDTIKRIEELSKEFIAYSINDDEIKIDKSQEVRNLASVCDVLKSIKFGFKPSKQFRTVTKNVLKFYLDKWKSGKLERQASIFLLEALNILNLEEDIRQTIVSSLVNNLDELEPKFELGEALFVLSGSGGKLRELVRLKINEMEFNSQELDEIFRLNWLSKSASLCDEDISIKILENCKAIINNFDEEIETNYLAVALEALTSLWRYWDDEIEVTVVNLIKSLDDRRVKGLWSFRSGECRIDISCHILNSFYNMMYINSDK